MSPMCRLRLNALPVFRLDPSADNPTARENKRVHAIVIDDGEFEIAIKRRS